MTMLFNPNAISPAPQAAPPREIAGVYIHWPFCARKCPYCDFYTFGAEHPSFSKSGVYLGALLAEISTLPERFNLTARPAVDTIYFGGGTPSLLEPAQLGAILAALRAVFEIDPSAEITMEVNPTAAEAARLAPALALGVNRLSIGCQSFDDRFLKLLGRDHDSAAARKTLRLAREVGFDNFSLDLMFGLPGQTLDDLRAEIDTALAFDPAHISAYGLTLHEGTPFKRWHEEKKWKLPGAETEAAQYELLIDRLADAGFVHYELSNWSLPNRASRHNSKYWRDCDVFALGASAHGVFAGARHSNPRDLADYLGAGGPPRLALPEPSPDSPRAAAGEIMMLALRRVEGVAWSEIDAWIAARAPGSPPARELYRAELASLAAGGFIDLPDSGIALSRRGILLADSVMERFF